MKIIIRAIWVLLSLLAASGVASAACVKQSINFGDTKQGTLATDDCIDHNGNGLDYYYDYYEFQGTAGQQILITNSSTVIDPDLLLIYPDSTATTAHTLYDDDGGGGVNARIPANTGFLTLTVTGVYAIVPSSAVSKQTGAYTLTLSLSTPPPTPPTGCSATAAPASTSAAPLQPGTSVQLSATCTAGTQPITFTWDGGAFAGAARTVAPTATTTYSVVASNAAGSAAAATIAVFILASNPNPTASPTYEFYNSALNHYFVTINPAEATAINNGSAGAGWTNTGYSFDTFAFPQGAADTKATLATNPVCRFYGTPGVGPNSHFYTVDANECALVKKDPGWFYEGIAFHIQPPQFGNCPTGTQPIYRAYNNRGGLPYNDTNHRFLTNKATFLAMGEQGWSMEGIVMCTTGVRSPAGGVTGGSFKDPSGSGASVDVSQGTIPPAINATGPATSRAPALPPGMNVDPQLGETNVTGSAPGYNFNLTGDSGFDTTAAGAVTITLPFNAGAIAPADLNNPLAVMARIFDPDDGSSVDVVGDVAVNGTSGTIKIETRGLPRRFTASVVYNPDMDATNSDETFAAASELDTTHPLLKVNATSWPAQSWCVLYNRRHPDLIAAVKTVLGIATNPSVAQIKKVINDKVAANAKKSQAIYQKDGLGAPNLVINRACGTASSRYNIHMVTQGSQFVGNDPGEAHSSGRNHYGRLYVSYSRIDDAANTDLGTVLASISHEMLHAVQSGYGVITANTKGYSEGSATVYGKTIDNSEVIKFRSETEILNASLMLTDLNYAYGNEDFFGYVARQYNGGSLNYLSGLYAQLKSAIGATVSPAASVTYNAMDTYFKATFAGQTLQSIYLDFVKQRALTHNANSQFGRAGEVVNNLAEVLFPGAVGKRQLDLANCTRNKITVNGNGFGSFATAVIVITPTGALPATSPNGVTLVVKVTPATSSIGALWNGWTYRANVATALAATNKFTLFGKSATDEADILVSNLDPANAGNWTMEISCAGVTIDSIAPVKGPVGTVVAITGSGFGTAADTRSISFNGTKATAVTFTSDTQASATVPAGATSGNVVVQVNADQSNGVNFDVVAVCNAVQTAGGDTPDTRNIDLVKTSGTFNFYYQTYSQEDEIIVRYENKVLFDTGCVGATATVPIHYSGTSSVINVQVIPNCKGGSGTAWEYSVSCP